MIILVDENDIEIGEIERKKKKAPQKGALVIYLV